MVSKDKINKEKEVRRTSRRSSLRTSSIRRIVPLRFISTADLSASSNLTVAAEWKTIDTLSLKILMSDAETPRLGSDMSPAMGTSLLSNSGESRRKLSKTYKYQIE